MSITIYPHCNLNPYDSYGIIAIQLMRHLTALGCHVNVHLRAGAICANLPPDIAEIIERPRHPSIGGIFLGWPTVFAEHGQGAHEHPRLVVTMFESSKLPPRWAGILNDFDGVIVPGQFCASVFRENGIDSPIHVAPLGIGSVYRGAERTANRPLTFLTFGDRGWRKGGITAINCFLKAFGDDTRYRLLVKQRSPRGEGFRCTNPNIEWIQQDMTEQELYQLYLRADVMISTNRGEGFGLLPREFAATGGIALATDWGGTADDLGLWGWPLPYKLVSAEWDFSDTPLDTDLGQWADPDEQGVAERLRNVAANIDTYREIARQQAPLVAQMYSWRTFAERVLNVWQSVSEKVTA